MSIATPVRRASSRIHPGRRRRPADARAYFASDRRRTIQTILGLMWLLDGALQFQPFMYSEGFVRTRVAGAAGQPAWLAVAVVLTLAYWLLGEAAGGLFTGPATDPTAGPLFVLLAAALWGVVCTARSRTRERVGAPRPRGGLRRGGSRRAGIAVMSAMCVAGALAGCGGSQTTSGIAAKSPGAIVSAATRAMESLRSVHVSGSQVQDGVPVSIDMDLVSGSGARGEMSVAGRAFHFVAVGQTLYISGGPAFWIHATGSSAAAQRFEGKWLKTSLGSAQFTAVASLTNLHDIVQSVVDGHGMLAPGPRATVNGRSAVTVHDTTRGGTMYIATVGRPYMLELSNPHTGLGHIMFDRFNAPVMLTPPADPIDAAQ
jgi:hypothetical protein